MSSRFFFLLLCTLLSYSVVAQMTVETNKANCRFEVGEQINFIVTSNYTGNATYTLQYDRFQEIQSNTIYLQAGIPTTVSYTANEPTVIVCNVNQGGWNVGTGAATVGAFEIGPIESEPADFDAFWESQKALLASVPIDPNLTLHSTSAYTKTYRINLAQIDNRRVYGFITVPNGSGNYPAVVTLPPYGSYANMAVPDPTFAEQSNTISMSISIHNAETNQVDNNAYTPNEYLYKEQNYYRYAVLAGIRAIDYLTSRPDVDSSKIGIFGNSQGGGLAMLIGGVDERVKVLMLTISALCLHEGYKYGRGAGFPYYLQAATGLEYPQEQTLNAVKYYDAVYAARRFKGSVLMGISYLDDTTPAASEFAAWNQFTGANKVLIHSTRLYHTSSSQMWPDRFKLLRRVWPIATADPVLPFGDNYSKGHWVEAGNDLFGQTNSAIVLNGEVSFNDDVNNSWPVQWEKVSGPGSITFSNATSRNTSATFSSNGTYVLRFRSHDNNTYAANNTYMTMEDFVTVTIGGDGPVQQNQTISFSSISNKLTTDNPFNIFATASSGLPVSFSILSGPATIAGNTISLTGQEGIVIIRASQSGNNDYYPASSQTQSFEVTAPDNGGNNGGNNDCTDSDNDGTCDEDDCFIWNPNLPAEPGTPCNDYDPHNFNDVIQADGCTCQGSNSDNGGNNGGNNDCTDSDNDGTCDIDDCFIWNPNLPTEPGTPCDDYDPHNFNDVIQADGCTCQGSNSDNGGNNGGNNDCTDSDNDGTCDVDDCFIWNPNLPAEPGTPCDDYDPHNFNDVIQADGCTCQGSNSDNGEDNGGNNGGNNDCTDSDNDGTCDVDDCFIWNPNLPAEPGTPCNDWDPHNFNDVIQADGCTCQGSSSNNGGNNGGNNNCTGTDSDNDGTCDIDDCFIWNPNLPADPGTPCNDWDPHNFNDVIQADGCTCKGSGSNIGNNISNENELHSNLFDFKIRPNPVDDFLISEFQNKSPEKPINQVNLFNAIGEKINLDQMEYQLNEDRFVLFTDNLKPGYYLISISYENEVVSKPFIKIQ